MSNDPGFANDTCIFMEAISGDGGTHNGDAVWWLSPDITLTGPDSGLDEADAGQSNPIKVKFHRKGAASGCHFPGDESITVELWVANPSLVMAPRASSSARVGFIGSPLPAEGGTGIQQIDWTPHGGLPLGNPEAGGHKCLVARCYPDSGSPSDTSFFVPGDQHVAQHNLCTVQIPNQALIFKINTLNPRPPQHPPPNLLQNSEIKLRAVLDLEPNNFVRHIVLSRLQLQSGFQQLRTAPLPQGFKFDLTGLHASQVVDHSQPGLNSFPPHTNPSFEAVIVLDTQRVTQLTFQASPRGTQPGEACIFHLTQSDTAGKSQGGLTVIMLRV
jgi:hypothetical protein